LTEREKEFERGLTPPLAAHSPVVGGGKGIGEK